MQLLLHLLAFFDDVGVSVIINCPLGGLTFIPREERRAWRRYGGSYNIHCDVISILIFGTTFFFLIHERFAIAQNTDEYLAVFS